jgi:hypothetical protein
MDIHVKALFSLDPSGRMVQVNEPFFNTAPRFFLGRTAKGCIWKFRFDVDDQLAKDLESECRNEHGNELRLPSGSQRYEDLLARSVPVQKRWGGPAYHFPNELPMSSGLVPITAENIDLLRPYLVDWLGDILLRPCAIAFVTEGCAVSVCCSVRTTETADEAGVETAKEFRGRGYAAQVVAAWANLVRCSGRIPLYSTSWHNTASQAVARKLKLQQYGTDYQLT